MKKLVLSIFALGLIFVSCSDDDTTDTSVVVEDTDISGTVADGETLTLSSGEEYTLSTTLIVENGGTLVLEAGTVVTADATGANTYIAIEQGGTITVDGDADNPVILTSENATAGDWGGLTICGYASTTAGTDATAEVGGLTYGGSDDEDSSGSIEYLVVKGSGASINSESQFNGISFYAVGSGTTVNNVAVIDGDDDGVEFFGGSVSVTNLYLKDNSDDAVDWTEGWDGTITNTYVSHTVSGFSTAIEADGTNGNPTITNFTAVSSVDGTALQFKKNSGATITNLYIDGYDTVIEYTYDTDEDAETVATYDVYVESVQCEDDEDVNDELLDAAGVDYTTFGLNL